VLRAAHIDVGHLPVDEVCGRVSAVRGDAATTDATLDAEKIEKSHKLVPALEFAHGGFLLLEKCEYEIKPKRKKVAPEYITKQPAPR
jgi:hypothetical protein